MKNIKKLLLSFIVCFVLLGQLTNVFAAAISVSPSGKSLQIGKSMTLTVNAKGYVGKFSFSCSSNLKINKSSEWIENSTTSITVTAVSEGPGTVSVSSTNVSTYGDTPVKVDVSGSASVTVVNASSGGNTGGTSGGNTGSETPDNRSGNNMLSNIEVSSAELNPKFDSKTTKYTVNLAAGTEKATISAKAQDSKAKVLGTGEKTLKVGTNTFTIICQAENGSRKTYTLDLIVDDKPTTFIDWNDKKFGFVTNLSDAKVPDGFAESKITIDSNEVTAFVNEKMGLTIAYLIDENNGKAFYIIEEGKIVRKYETLSILGKNYVIIDASDEVKKQLGLKESAVKIGEIEIQGWVFEDENHTNYSVVYLMNDTGEKSLYSYEATEGTLQKYVASQETSNNTLTYAFMGSTVLFAAGCGTLAYLYISFKKKSISAIKEYYDKKNQGE